MPSESVSLFQVSPKANPTRFPRGTTLHHKALLEIIALTHAGITTDEFDNRVKNWLTTAKHPKFNRPYNECIYQPMLEVLTYLRANGFKTWIVSGGGQDFMRVFAEATKSNSQHLQCAIFREF